VAAGKLVAERTRMAREQQKKAAAEAAIIIANNKAKATTAATEPAPTTEDENPKNNSLSTTQWLAVGSLIVSLVGLYYKREELKTVFRKKHLNLRVLSHNLLARHIPKGVRHID